VRCKVGDVAAQGNEKTYLFSCKQGITPRPKNYKYIRKMMLANDAAESI
jgi:hypothetical protein